MFQRQMGGNPKQMGGNPKQVGANPKQVEAEIQSKWGPIQLLGGLGRLGGFPAYLPASS